MIKKELNLKPKAKRESTKDRIIRIAVERQADYDRGFADGYNEAGVEFRKTSDSSLRAKTLQTRLALMTSYAAVFEAIARSAVVLESLDLKV